MIAIVALMTMALSLLSMRRHPCHCQAGIVALVTMASLPLIHDSVVALIAMASLLSSSWHCCPRCNGIVFIIDVVALVACHQAGIVALIVMALLHLMHWCLCLYRNGDCCSRHDGVVDRK
jgi:hypothetical protein